jgi:tRNA nucleotidyltransferase (CCA-adding enzyme)
MEIYRVGGAVRDHLLGLAVKEKDYVVVGASPEALLALGFKPVGKDFPVFLHPITHEEYALARTERKKGPGYTGFSVYAAPEVTLKEDLQRRDLTINAIAETDTGEIIDPYEGCRDIEKKVLRHVSPAFIEDPVRILRVARFMARFSTLGFHIAPETLEFMREMVHNGEVDALVPERIWREFQRALSEPSPIEFINALEKCGAWRRICPEWMEISPDRQSQALRALQIATTLTEDTTVRFVSLMKCIASETQQLEPAQRLAKRWHLPVVYRDLLILSIRYSEQAHQVNQIQVDALLDLLERVDALRRKDRFQKFLTVCEADWESSGHYAGELYQQKATLLAAAKAVQSVPIEPLLKKGLQGEVFSQQLRQLRIQTLGDTTLP